MLNDAISLMRKYSDMNMFETANHLASWSGLKPRNDESNKKIKSRSITHGNVYLCKTIIECAWAASRTKDCFLTILTDGYGSQFEYKLEE